MSEKQRSNYPQGNLGEINDSEHRMVHDAINRYGEYYVLATNVSVFLSLFMKSISKDRHHFAAFFAHLKKHHLLAIFSTVRLHKIQASMNLRQVLEVGALAAFAIANTEDHHFVEHDSTGMVKFPQKLRGKIYDWLNKEFPAGSATIKTVKDALNDYDTHASLLAASQIFDVKPEEFSAPFFDYEDPHFVKTDLWRLADVGIGLLDLFYGVWKKHGGFVPTDDFLPQINELSRRKEALKAEMMNTERYKNAMRLDAERKAQTTAKATTPKS